jgi:hypothetical protein
MRRSIDLLAIFLGLVPLQASADIWEPLTLVYEQPMGGVYTQSWYTKGITKTAPHVATMYVEGFGKSGDFYGILSVDCDVPTQSVWLANGSFLTPDSLPPEAINGIQAIACAQ